MKYGLLIILLFAVCGCQPADSMFKPAAADNHSVSASAPPPWVNRVWVRSDRKDHPGELRIFFADGTLVMDSCWETYRLAEWEKRSDSVVVWYEDTAEIEAHLEMIGPEQLQMQLKLVGGTVTEQYHEADVPYICPDMKR